MDDGSHEANVAGAHIAHEVAHYYWSGSSDWIDEGAAEFLASVAENSRTGEDVEVTNYPCAYADSIARLESLNAPRGSPAFHCNYALGERLFVDLYRGLGKAAFQRGFRNLYRLSEAEDDPTEASTGVAIGDRQERL